MILEAAAARDQDGRCVLEQVVEVAARGAAQLQDIAEAARRHKGGARTFLLEHRVGDHGGGMRQQADIGGGNAVAVHGGRQRGEHALAQVTGRGRYLGDADAPRRLLDQRHVGERPADVDADPPGHVTRGTPGALWCTQSSA
jgi:hypothetical protein